MDKTPEKPASRTSKARSVKSADPKPSIIATRLQEMPVAPKRKASTKKAAPTAPPAPHIEAMTSDASTKTVPDVTASGINLDHMIATAAYYLAEQRHFAPGYEMQDWLTAEQMIRELTRK